VSTNDFKDWVRGIDDPSRKYVRDYIISKGYKHVLDVGAGLCDDYDGFKRDGKDIFYTAADFTDKFFYDSNRRGINIVKANCDNLPYVDLFFDVAYCRHLVEHLPYYDKTLDEMIRVSRKEVVVTFFLPVRDVEDDEIRVIDHLNHNIYSKPKIEKFLDKHDRVVRWKWEDSGKDEQILSIKLK